MDKFTGDDLLWNWVRWCWSGDTVGNMQPYVRDDDDFRPIHVAHALAVDALYQCLPREQALAVQAEYTRKNTWFRQHTPTERRVLARRWIQQATGRLVRDDEYLLWVADFKSKVEKEVWI